MFLDDGLGATPEKRTPSFSWIAAISIIVGFVYPFVAVLVAPDRCEATCEVALAYSPAPIYAVGVAVVVSLRRGVVRGVAFGIAGAVLGILEPFTAVVITYVGSGASFGSASEAGFSSFQTRSTRSSSHSQPGPHAHT